MASGPGTLFFCDIQCSAAVEFRREIRLVSRGPWRSIPVAAATRDCVDSFLPFQVIAVPATRTYPAGRIFVCCLVVNLHTGSFGSIPVTPASHPRNAVALLLYLLCSMSRPVLPGPVVSSAGRSQENNLVSKLWSYLQKLSCCFLFGKFSRS